jgi:hypothetical protein
MLRAGDTVDSQVRLAWILAQKLVLLPYYINHRRGLSIVARLVS